VGDKRKFPAVLIAPYFPLLEDWARNHQITFSSRAQLVQHPDVQALFDGIVEEINQNLARFEKLKRTILLPDEFTPQDGMLTHSMKVRRRAVEERYRQLIDEVYAHAEAAPVVGHVTGD
jgi:long-chain acyl-CoA synthetase